MVESDRPQFAALMKDVMSFYRRDVSEFLLGTWWDAMRPFDFESVKQALSRHAMNPDTGQFAPMPADAIKMLAGSTQDSALRAWSKVDRAVRHVGTYQTVAFDDPLIHRVLHDMGGWVGLGRKEEKEWPFVMNEFVTRYRSFRMRGEVPDFPPTLTGLTESENSSRGFNQAVRPMLVGDPDRAKRVIAKGSSQVRLQFSQMPALADLSSVDAHGE